MKNTAKLLSIALTIVLSISMFTVVAYAENQGQTPSITTNEYFNKTMGYCISGLRKDYSVPGNYIGYGYANDSFEVEAAQAALEKVNYSKIASASWTPA